MIRVVIFDLDGTIADTIPANNVSVNVLNTIAKEFNLKPFTIEDVEAMREKRIQDLFKDFHIPLYKLPFVLKKIRAELHKEIITSKPIDGIAPILNNLKQSGYMLGILSSASKHDITSFFARNKIDVFDFVYSGISLFSKHKRLEHLLNKCHLKQNEIIYIGDEIRDIEASKAAKVKVIAVTWGFNSKKSLEKYNPDFLVTSPKQIQEILNNKISLL